MCIRDRPKSDSNFRQKYLVNTPMPGRIQVYLNRKLYYEIKNYLNVIAPEVSIASYISNIIAEHIELNIEEITRMYKAVSYTHLDVYKRQVICHHGTFADMFFA